MSKRVGNATRVARLTIAAVLAAVLMHTATTYALHRFTPPVVQATQMSGGDVGKVVAKFPDQWIFESDGDPLGNANATWQIFMFSLITRDMAGQPGLFQLTYGSHNARNPSMSQNGQTTNFNVVFEADGDFCADPLNTCAAGSTSTAGRQIYLWNSFATTIYQLTSYPSGDVHNPAISGNGGIVVFESSTDLLGTGAPGTVTELYEMDLNQTCPQCVPVPPSKPSGLAPVTKLTTGGGTGATLDKRGVTIAFESRGDILFGGKNPGTQQIYLIAKDRTLHQLTRGTNDARHPSINYSGTLVGYEWDVPQTTGPSISQIFTAFFHPGRPIVFTQISKAGAQSINPSLSVNGRRLTFLSQDSSGAFQVFQWFKHHGVTQYTTVPEGVGAASSSIFQLSALTTSADLKNTGNTTPQLFVLNPFPGAPPDFRTPYPGTPTVPPQSTPVPGGGTGMSLAILSRAEDNGDNTVTAVIDATLQDSTGNPVPDGTAVHFAVGLLPGDTITVTDAATGALPSCNVTAFQASTGITIVAQPGIAHSCVTYPKTMAGHERNFSASATTADGPMSTSKTFTLMGGGFATPTPTRTATPTRTKTTTPTRTPTPKKT